MSPPLPQDDLDDVVRHVGELWERLDGARVFFTGASGFFGSWMLESFLHAGTRRNLPFRALALTRDASRFARQLPHIAADPRVEILEADITRISPPDGPVDFVIHSLVPDPGTSLPEMDRFFQEATIRLLDMAVSKSPQAFLLCSTGAVYRPKDPPAPFSEDDPLRADGESLSYGLIRSRVESQCRRALGGTDTCLTIARGFSFLGPRLPLDGAFAAGNFLRDALAGGPVVVKGDGRAVRSYLYASDMAAVLWRALIGSECGVLNLGSPHGISIGELAATVGDLFGVQVVCEHRSMPGAAPDYYVPATGKYVSSLLGEPPALKNALLQTAKYGNKRSTPDARR